MGFVLSLLAGQLIAEYCLIYLVCLILRRFPDLFPSKFEATHPELTNEEYLQLFDWPVNPEVALKVRKILAEISCLPENRIRPQDRLGEDLYLD